MFSDLHTLHKQSEHKDYILKFDYYKKTISECDHEELECIDASDAIDAIDHDDTNTNMSNVVSS